MSLPTEDVPVHIVTQETLVRLALQDPDQNNIGEFCFYLAPDGGLLMHYRLADKKLLRPIGTDKDDDMAEVIEAHKANVHKRRSE